MFFGIISSLGDSITHLINYHNTKRKKNMHLFQKNSKDSIELMRYIPWYMYFTSKRPTNADQSRCNSFFPEGHLNNVTPAI